MEGLLPVLAGLLVVSATVLVIWRRRSRDGATGPQPRLHENAIESAIPTFRIVSVGLQGSGKTLLLASMFHQLKAPTNQSYYLSVKASDLAKLTEWFYTMADASKPRNWPLGTASGEIRRFLFGVRTRSAAGVHEVMRLDYLEYAGELLTDTRDDGSTRQDELVSHIQEADALLGVLDGRHIQQWLAGREEGWLRLEQTLNILVPHLMEARGPISFVITKWDLLAAAGHDENARLAVVRNLLMQNDHFRTLIELQGTDRIVRLVPVSAVGPGFVHLDAQGVPAKVPTARVHPTNTDIPLSAVVPDVFDQVERNLQGEFRAKLEEERRKFTHRSPLDRLAAAASLTSHAAGRGLLQAFGSPVAVLMGDVLVGMFLDTRRDSGLEQRTQQGRELNEAEQRVEAFLEARRRVLRDMRGKVSALEGRMPHSRLTRG